MDIVCEVLHIGLNFVIYCFVVMFFVYIFINILWSKKVNNFHNNDFSKGIVKNQEKNINVPDVTKDDNYYIQSIVYYESLFLPEDQIIEDHLLLYDYVESCTTNILKI